MGCRINFRGLVIWKIRKNDLETKEIETFNGALQGKVTLAHMKHDMHSDHLIAVTTKRGKNTKLCFHEFDSQFQEVQKTEGELIGTAFVHDFCVSKNWYIVGGNPLSIDLWKAGKAYKKELED